jgi:hypothetical protein
MNNVTTSVILADSKSLAVIEEIKDIMKSKTCIQLVPRSNQAGYI